MKHTFEHEITSILLDQNLISSKEAIALEYAFARSDADQFEDFLLEEGLVAENDLLAALSQYYQVLPFDVVGYFFERFLLKKFPKGFLLRCGIIPLEADNEYMTIIASNPHEPGLREEIARYVSYDINFMVGTRRDICDAIKEFYDKSETEVSDDMLLFDDTDFDTDDDEDLDFFE